MLQLKKFTLIVDSKIRANSDWSFSQSEGYHKAFDLAGQLCAYATLVRDYVPPCWINYKDERALYKAMAPYEAWAESNWMTDAFRRAFRVECIVGMDKYAQGCLAVSLRCFERNQREPFYTWNHTMRVDKENEYKRTRERADTTS